MTARSTSAATPTQESLTVQLLTVLNEQVPCAAPAPPMPSPSARTVVGRAGADQGLDRTVRWAQEKTACAG
jgi:hypothetical protein